VDDSRRRGSPEAQSRCEMPNARNLTHRLAKPALGRGRGAHTFEFTGCIEVCCCSLVAVGVTQCSYDIYDIPRVHAKTQASGVVIRRGLVRYFEGPNAFNAPTISLRSLLVRRRKHISTFLAMSLASACSCPPSETTMHTLPPVR
jgi:hypothetical protein